MKKIIGLAGAVSILGLLAGCAGKASISFEQLDGHYSDHVASESLSDLIGSQAFMGHKKLGFGSPPGVVFPNIQGYKIIQANFIYKDREPAGFTTSHASRDEIREIVSAERRILGECDWECVYEEVIWAKVPEDYVRAHRDAGFTINFMSESGRTEKMKVSGEDAKKLDASVWNKARRR